MGEAIRVDDIQTEQVRRETLTVSEAALVLGVSKSTAYELVRTGELPALRLGRRIVVPNRALQSLLAAADGPSADAVELSARSFDGD